MRYADKKLFLLIILSCLFFLSLTKSSFAQNAPSNYDVTVSPVFFDLSSNPGDTVSDKIRIRNNTTSPIPVKITVQKLTGDVNGDVILQNASGDETISWVKFSQISFVAKPLEWTDIPFSINIPKDAAYGYYLAISFEQDNSSPLARTGAKITGAAAVPILLNVRKEGASADAKITEFKTKKTVYETLPIEFVVKIENGGNIHVKPHGNIFLSDWSNKDIGILDVNQGLANIIPQTVRSFDVSWTDGFIVREPVTEDGQTKLDKNGKIVTKLTFNWDKLTSFRFGKYTASLFLVFDNGKRDVSLESTISFWVIPYKGVIVILVSVLAIILIIRYFLRKYIKSQIKKGQT